jgi:FdhD protein
MQTIDYEGMRFDKDGTHISKEMLAVEAALQIDINGEPYTVVMRTPGDDHELIRGLLYAEDIYKGSEILHMETLKTDPNGFSIIDATIPKHLIGDGYMNKRTLLSVSSCGICGKQKLDDIAVTGKSIGARQIFDVDRLSAMFAALKSRQSTFSLTGGTHAAALFDSNYEILTVKEDIGRHNAVDKVVGSCLYADTLSNGFALLVSGRVSYEIISKAFIARIPYVAGVSACSSLAVDFAKEFGIGLIGFSRKDRATIYAFPERQ